MRRWTSPPSRRRWYDGVIARRADLLVPSLFLLGLLAVACGDDPPSAADERADQVADAARDAGLDDDVAELLADAARGDGTYRVTYELEDRTVVVTQRPPDRRVDTTEDDGTVDAVVSVDGTTHACTRPPDGDWTCEDLGSAPPEGLFDPAAVVELSDALAAGAPEHDFAVEDREVADTEARCLVTRVRTTDEVDGRLCVAESGAILLVERPAGTLRAREHTTDVPDDAFVVPA